MTTIVDVARAAGVSTATVSRVLNNHPQVESRLAATVVQAVKDLAIVPAGSHEAFVPVVTGSGR